jgi:hypothetical protein
MRGVLLLGEIEAHAIASIAVVRNVGMLVQNRAVTETGLLAVQPMILGLGFNRGPVRAVRVEALPDFVIDCTEENLGKATFSTLSCAYAAFVEQGSYDKTYEKPSHVTLPTRADVARVRSYQDRG